MTQNVANRLDVKSKKSMFLGYWELFSKIDRLFEDDIPDGLFRQMTTCQTAANEFLRQFWLAIYPPLGELQTAASATPAQRATKAAKMIGYISKTHEKVYALVKTAEQHGIDAIRVEHVSPNVLCWYCISYLKNNE
jgi:transcription initiation factor TFIIH subunit 1